MKHKGNLYFFRAGTWNESGWNEYSRDGIQLNLLIHHAHNFLLFASEWAIVRADGIVIAQSKDADVAALKAMLAEAA